MFTEIKQMGRKRKKQSMIKIKQRKMIETKQQEERN